MPLSNQIPSSRLIQPGVVDSAATRPASPFEGQCIFQKDTDQLLVWNGTAWIGTEKLDSLQVSLAGYVSMPNQPIISGQIGSFGSITSGQLIPFDDFWVSRGITYNSTTRRFTVPITGIYRITMNPFFQTGAGSKRVTIGVDTDTPSQTTHRGMCYSESSVFDTACLNSVVSINANSYIVFRVQEGTIYNQTNDRFNQFSIELIG